MEKITHKCQCGHVDNIDITEIVNNITKERVALLKEKINAYLKLRVSTQQEFTLNWVLKEIDLVFPAFKEKK